MGDSSLPSLAAVLGQGHCVCGEHSEEAARWVSCEPFLLLVRSSGLMTEGRHELNKGIIHLSILPESRRAAVQAALFLERPFTGLE